VSGAAYQVSSHNSTVLYSIAAQATTTATVETGATVTSTNVVTGSGTLTATATTTNTTNTTPGPTAVPLPTVGPQGSLQINPFDWNFLTSAPKDPYKIGPFAIAFLVLMVALIAAGIYFLRFKRPQWKGTNSVLFKAVNRFAPYALWIGAIGILFLMFRIISLDFFNLRFWLYLDFLALLALAGWIIFWYRTSYPKEMAKFQKTQKARQYMPSGGGKVPSRSTPLATPPTKANQPKTGGTSQAKGTPASGPKPNQQSSKSRKRR
jgi:hypothetical protein